MNTFGQYSLSGGCKLARRLLFPPCLGSDCLCMRYRGDVNLACHFFRTHGLVLFACGGLRSESFQEKPSHPGIAYEADVSMVGGIDFNHV